MAATNLPNNFFFFAYPHLYSNHNIKKLSNTSLHKIYCLYTIIWIWLYSREKNIYIYMNSLTYYEKLSKFCSIQRKAKVIATQCILEKVLFRFILILRKTGLTKPIQLCLHRRSCKMSFWNK